MFKRKKKKNKIKNVPPKRFSDKTSKRCIEAMNKIIERMQLRNFGDIRII